MTLHFLSAQSPAKDGFKFKAWETDPQDHHMRTTRRMSFTSTGPFGMEFNRGESLQKLLFQEAIENIQHVLILLNAWAPRRHGGPVRLVGAPPPAPKPDSRLVLTYFGALKTLSLADEPKVKVSIAPLDEDQIHKQREFRLMGRWPDDEVLKREKLALRSSFAEGKILIPVHEPTNSANPYFKFDEAKQWIDLKAKELPGWGTPEVQYSMIIPDPQG
jgi:hypothetical protein